MNSTRQKNISYLAVGKDGTTATHDDNEMLVYAGQDTILLMPEHNVYGIFDGLASARGNSTLASQMAAKFVAEEVLLNDSSKIESALVNNPLLFQDLVRDLIHNTRQNVIANSAGGLTTALVVMIAEANNQQTLGFVNAGDSSLLKYNDSQGLSRLNTEQANFGVKTNWLGEDGSGRRRLVNDEIGVVALTSVDIVVLCSDGITGHTDNRIDDNDLVAAFSSSDISLIADSIYSLSKKHDDKSLVVIGQQA